MASDDERLIRDQVAFWVGYYRAKLVKEYWQKYKSLDPQYTQDLGCVELVCVDKADCCQAFIDETYKKLKIPLPALLDLSDGQVQLSVNKVDKVEPIAMLSPTETFYKSARKYGAQDVSFFRIGTQLYFSLPKFSRIKYINIRTVLADPRDASQFTSCSGDPCFDEWETQYPIPPFMIQTLTEMIMQRELNLTMTSKPLDDTTNDRMEIQGPQGR